jgi:hypothetical protein
VVASSNQAADGKELESARDIERSRNIIETMSTSKHLLVLSSRLLFCLLVQIVDFFFFKYSAKTNTFYAHYTFDS